MATALIFIDGLQWQQRGPRVYGARAPEARIPLVLHGRIGPQAVTAWAELGDEVGVKREIIRTVADIGWQCRHPVSRR